jgi:hypothetical protein
MKSGFITAIYGELKAQIYYIRKTEVNELTQNVLPVFLFQISSKAT